METNSSNNLIQHNVSPSAVNYYSFAWKKLWKYFLELLLVTIVSIVVMIPSIGLDNNGYKYFADNSIAINFFFISFEGVAAFIIFALAYLLLLQWPLEYGISFVNLEAAREKKFNVTDMFLVFKNYWNAVFANLLVVTIVGFGFMMFIIPGIIFACKLAFVSYLIVDKKMDAVEAVKKSWRMTTGHTGTIFLMGVLAFFISILGLLFVGVGIVISIMWIHLAFAAVYYHVSELEKAKLKLTDN